MNLSATNITPPGRRADQLIERPLTAADFDGITTAVDELFTSASAQLRDPRSDEYKAGCRAALEFRIDGVRIIRPYLPGTAGDDAFDGGMAEGHSIWRSAIAAGEEFSATGRLPRRGHAHVASSA
jgi:hypothetical protein